MGPTPISPISEPSASGKSDLAKWLAADRGVPLLSRDPDDTLIEVANRLASGEETR